MTQKIKPRHPEKVKNPINPIKKKPDWIRSKLSNSKEFFLTKTIVNQNNLVTVCQEANCPNISECWSKRHATFMIMGDTCTRACAFCDVKTGKPGKLDDLEPIMSRWLIGTKRNKRRCLYENKDIFVEHFVADFQDGTTEAVLTVHLLKDGLLWRTETGSTPIEKSKAKS